MTIVQERKIEKTNTHLTLFEKVGQELHGVGAQDADVAVRVPVRRHELRLDAPNFGHLALCQLFGLLRLLLDGRDLDLVGLGRDLDLVGLLTLGGAFVSSFRFGGGILDIVRVDRAGVEAEGADLVRDVLRDLDADLETYTPVPRVSQPIPHH